MGEMHPGELARLQQHVLTTALGGGALPDLRLARSSEGVALSKVNLDDTVDLSGLPQPVRLISAEAEAAHLAFTPPEIHGEELSLTIQVRASPPQGGGAAPLSAMTLRFRRQGDNWTPAAPPAALST